MIRLVMQHESPKTEPLRTFNGNGQSHGAELNLDYRIFDVTCPELEKALKAMLMDGANVKKLVLRGIEIVPDPPKPKVPALAELPAPMTEEERHKDDARRAAELKARLTAKRNGASTLTVRQPSRWARLWGHKPKPAALPLP